jgi:DivIVA domain-containing protein
LREGSEVGHTRLVTADEPPQGAPDQPETAPATREPLGLRDVRDPLPEEVRDPSFGASVRGYDRRAVDRYVERVNGLIAELQVSGSPPAAVRHALDRVGEQTSGILQRARETAEEITTSAREEAEETTARAKAEAQEIVARASAEAEAIRARAKEESEATIGHARLEAERCVRQSEEEAASVQEQAEARVRVLQAEIAAVSDERRILLDEVRRIAARLDELVAEAQPLSATAASQEEDDHGGDAEGRA